jgi:hypothetical protein
MGLARETVSAVRGLYLLMICYVVVTHRFKVFLIATNQISQSKNPLVHEVIPVFDIISRALDDHIGDVTLPTAVRVAAARGRTMLNKYYGLTDDSIVYRIAMRKSCNFFAPLCASSTNTFGAHTLTFRSAASQIQGIVFPQSIMASRMDYHSGRPSAQGVELELQTNTQCS